jgi:hypothetical protein
MPIYTGGCHCGRVTFQVTADVQNAITCNCSLCSKKGYVLSFVPAEQFTLLTGEDVLTDYQFNKKIIHHLFCSVCGVGSFGRGIGPDGKASVAINLRCLNDLDLAAVPMTEFDGKSR